MLVCIIDGIFTAHKVHLFDKQTKNSNKTTKIIHDLNSKHLKMTPHVKNVNLSNPFKKRFQPVCVTLTVTVEKRQHRSNGSICTTNPRTY